MSYTQLTYEQRYLIYHLLKMGISQSRIAEIIGVHKSTISRELKRNRGQRGYRYKQAHRKAMKRQNKAKKRIGQQDWAKIEEYLKKDWSPEQVSEWARERDGISVSHEWIYQHIQEDKEKGGTLHEHLRHRKKYRKRRQNGDQRGVIPNRQSIEERPVVVDKRERLGDWEADTIIGKERKGALVTLVDRKSRFLRMGQVERRTKAAVSAKIIDLLADYPVHTITCDNGKEFADHEEISESLCAEVYFAHPYASWERGTNENTNGLIRQYFPKGTDFETLDEKDVQFVENCLNLRPRKCLGFVQPMVFLKTHRCT
jgi:IS30 family transposase